MLLRHLCQLTAQPLQGVTQVLLPAIVARMPEMTMQELSCLLHVAVVWRLKCKVKLASAVAALVGAAAGLPACADAAVAAAAAAARAPAVAANDDMPDGWWLLDQQLEHVMQHSTVPRTQAAAASPAAAAGRHQQHRQQHPQQRQLLPRTAADPVIFLHRLVSVGCNHHGHCSTGCSSRLVPHLHKISLLQACLLRRPWCTPGGTRWAAKRCWRQACGPGSAAAAAAACSKGGGTITAMATGAP